MTGTDCADWRRLSSCICRQKFFKLLQQFEYFTFGLSIRSDFKLQGLSESSPVENPEVFIRRCEGPGSEQVPADHTVFNRPRCVVRAAPGFISYDWADLGEVIVKAGNEVRVRPADGVSDEDIAPFLTGAVLGNLLEQRGEVVLHGSAVCLGDSAVAFLGDKGAGKSTLALGLERAGFDLVTDDLLPVNFYQGSVSTSPGGPQIKLWRDSAESIGLEPAALPRISRFIDKRAYRPGSYCSRNKIEIGSFYVLVEGETTLIERLPATEAFVELTRNAYIARYLVDTQRSASHFQTLTSIVKSIPVYRLSRPFDFRFSSSVIKTVLDHASGLRQTGADRIK